MSVVWLIVGGVIGAALVALALRGRILALRAELHHQRLASDERVRAVEEAIAGWRRRSRRCRPTRCAATTSSSSPSPGNRSAATRPRPGGAREAREGRRAAGGADP